MTFTKFRHLDQCAASDRCHDFSPRYEERMRTMGDTSPRLTMIDPFYATNSWRKNSIDRVTLKPCVEHPLSVNRHRESCENSSGQ